MSNPNDHPENLSVRSRRGGLLSGEEAELERVLEASPTLRMAHQVGEDFDQIAAVEGGDEQRVARFVERALAARAPRRRHRFARPRLSPLMAAAAALTVCGVALGLRGLWWPQLSATLATPNAPASPHRTHTARNMSAPRTVAEPSDETSAVTTQFNQKTATPNLPILPRDQSSPLNPTSPIRTLGLPTALPTPEAARNDSPRKDSTATFSTDQPAESNAAALLRQANRARSAGEIDRAALLFKELQTKFGSSPEAHVSLVSLGKLLMLSGSREAALQQFTSYLERSGSLEEEALVGRAQALQGLGRTSEERSTWQRLMARFPSSVYAAAARKRLAALAQGAAE